MKVKGLGEVPGELQIELEMLRIEFGS